MKKLAKKTVTLAIIIFMVLAINVFEVRAQRSQPGEAATSETMIVDLVLARPLGLIATGVGILFFTVSLPFSAAGGNAKEAFNKLVTEPCIFTFSRPLGVMKR